MDGKVGCPFYEEYAGEYWQGCWEFTDLCFLGQDLDESPFCNNNCWYFAENDLEVAVDMIDRALNKPYTTYEWTGMKFVEKTVISKLSEWRKKIIIDDFNRIIDTLNKREEEIQFFE